MAARFIVLILGPLLLSIASCVSSSSVGYVDDGLGVPPHLFKNPPRIWIKDSTITVEVEQTRGPGEFVARIGYRIDDSDVYLIPYHISSGRGGKSLLTVDLRAETLPKDWQDRVYWLTGESLYPIGHSAFWDRSLREPSRRVKVAFSPPPD